MMDCNDYKKKIITQQELCIDSFLSGMKINSINFILCIFNQIIFSWDVCKLLKNNPYSSNFNPWGHVKELNIDGKIVHIYFVLAT